MMPSDIVILSVVLGKFAPCTVAINCYFENQMQIVEFIINISMLLVTAEQAITNI